MKKVKQLGIVFGTYAPMHIGHVDLITRAKRENDHVLVVVSGTNTQRDRGTQIGLPVSKRFRYVREVFTGDPLVTVQMLDEEHIPEYPNGWSPWLDEMENLIGQFETNRLTFYVGEAEYEAHLLERFNNADVILADRSIIPISATAIRNNPLAHFDRITQPFRRHFTKKVLIAGSASGGKSTLTIDLARVYNAAYSDEYARTYQKLYNVRDEELVEYDFVHLTTDQYKQTQNTIDYGNHRGLVFADTNSSVTKAYFDWYCTGATDEQKDMFEKLYQSTVAREQWDLVLFVMPQSEYVDDGVRDMTMADQQIRDAFTQHLLQLLEPFKDKIVILESDNPETFFADNYVKAKAAIEERLGITL